MILQQTTMTTQLFICYSYKALRSVEIKITENQGLNMVSHN